MDIDLLEGLSRPPCNQRDIALTGCTSEPMSNYLKALGILEVVNKQLDSQATGYWQGNIFILRTSCTKEEIVDFFLHKYKPSPACSPWNGNSGFWENCEEVSQILAAASPRFSSLRNVYTIAKEFVEKSGLKQQPKDAKKVEFVQKFKSTISDERWQDWYSAVMVEKEIVSKKKGITYELDMPKLLGTGGNIGTSDLGFYYAQAIIKLWDLNSGTPLSKCEQRIRSSLFCDFFPGILDTKGLTQFYPASDFYTEYKEQKSKDYAPAKGKSTAASNPFDLILAIEGLFLFSGLSYRQLESNNPTISKYSLAVSLNTALDPSSASDEVRGKEIEEIWVPIWENLLTADGLREDLFNKGRNRLPEQVLDSIDFAAEVSQWGAKQTINRFVRYGFLNRKGQANFSICLGQFSPREGLVDFANELRGYRQSMKKFCRRKEATPKLEALFNRLESSIFKLLGSDGSVIDVLVAIGALESYISHSGEIGKDYVPSPCGTLPSKWLTKALEEEETAEARLALPLASCDIRSLLYSLARSDKGDWKWDKDAKPCWINGSPINSLIELQRYWELNEKQKWFISAWLSDVSVFIVQGINLKRFEELVKGFAICSFKDFDFIPPSDQQNFFISPLYAACTTCVWGKRRDGIDESNERVAEHTQSLVRLLTLNQPERAGNLALRLLRSAGYRPKVNLLESSKRGDINHRILAASLAFPVKQNQINRYFFPFFMPKEKKENTEEI